MMHKKPQRNDQPGDALDQRIDEALRERFQPPSTDAILKAAGVGAGGTPSGGDGPVDGFPAGPVLAAWVAAAAAVMVGVLLLGKRDQEAPAPQDDRVTEWITKYDDLNDEGAAPVCECDPESESFAEHCYKTFAQALNIPAEAAVELLGESCCDPDDGSVSLVARCDGETVCLFVLLREAAPIIHEKLRRGLSIHRRDVGALSAFELTSRPEPTILPHLVIN